MELERGVKWAGLKSHKRERNIDDTYYTALAVEQFARVYGIE
jgi:hypothetical protein